MRNLVAIALLSGAALSGGEFVTGMAARAVIGQRTFTAQIPGTSDLLVGGVSGIAYSNGLLVVVDDNRVAATPQNSRVLLFRDLSRKLPGPTDELPVIYERCLLCIQGADTVLGQEDFGSAKVGLNEQQFNQPTGVATDGRVLAVADTNNNRVLIWRTIPTRNYQPADIVLGQADFRSSRANEGQGNTPSNRSFRGPQGVWIHGGRLFVADTQNNRVLIWRSIPNSNNAPADVVLGARDFNTLIQPDLTKATIEARADTMLNPASVTTDGSRLYVADLGHNRVLIWNRIPDSNGTPADVVLGQPDFTSAIANNTPKLCASEGKNDKGEDLFPFVCDATMDFPRFVLSDGERLFVADGGNDRVLVYNRIPTQNGQKPDAILGQVLSTQNQSTDGANPEARASSDSIRTPMALAWDGTNLFVTEPFSRRVLVFTPAEPNLPYNGVRNSASLEVFAVGSLALSGNAKENDEITIKIKGNDAKEREYKYKIKKDEKFPQVVTNLAAAINARTSEADGDPWVLAIPNPVFNAVILTSRISGDPGNSIEYSSTTSTGAEVVVTTGGAKLSGGQNAAKIAPGTIVTIRGKDLADSTFEADTNRLDVLPRELGGVQVYIDGVRAPLYSVAPTQVVAQVPFEVQDSTSVSCYVRTTHAGGRVTVTTAIAVPVIPANPGIYALDGPDPRPGLAYHYSSAATGTISVDGTAQENDRATVRIEDRSYSYTVKKDDNLENIRDGLIDAINANPEEKVIAFPAGVFTRIRLRAKVEGPAGNGITIAGNVNDGAQVILTATNSELCCANAAGAPVTEANPALPGETIVVYATGLGLVEPEDALFSAATGAKYRGPEINRPLEFVSSLAGGKTANVLYSGLRPETFNLYEVHLELNSDLPTNPQTQLTIAQDIYVSNIITFPVKNQREGETLLP